MVAGRPPAGGARVIIWHSTLTPPRLCKPSLCRIKRHGRPSCAFWGEGFWLRAAIMFHHPLPRRAALRAAAMLRRASEDAGLHQLLGERGEVRFGVRLGSDLPHGSLVAASGVYHHGSIRLDIAAMTFDPRGCVDTVTLPLLCRHPVTTWPVLHGVLRGVGVASVRGTTKIPLRALVRMWLPYRVGVVVIS